MQELSSLWSESQAHLEESEENGLHTLQQVSTAYYLAHPGFHVTDCNITSGPHRLYWR